MLYYSSIHPDWDYAGAFGQTDTARQISALLDTIATNHYRNTQDCFSELERLGIVLGNGGFEAALIQKDPFGQIERDDRAWIRAVVETAREKLSLPLWLCFSVCGRLYILCCFSRMQEGSAKIPEAKQKLLEEFETFELPSRELRMLISDFQFGESGVFRCFNNLHHAMEYYDFRRNAPRMVQLDSEQQLHGAFIQDMSAYRQFSVVIAEELVQEACDIPAISRQICETMLQNSVSSMESVHHHVQMFMLSFTDYLGSSGLVDAAYLRRHSVVYRAMGFETEQDFLVTIETLLEELRRQHQTLRAIGKQKRIQSIREYVESHITQPELTVTLVSEEFRISPAQATKQFRYYFGVSLHRFIQQTRFQYAAALIKDRPDYSMLEVSKESGYTDLSTMYRAFRLLGGITPGALKGTAQQSLGADERRR